MSPSPAMKTSSPCERKILLGSPGLLAKPKNLRLMGGGGGGPCGTIGAADTCTGTIGFGISTSARKMFLPVPEYLVSSLAFSQSYRSVGSSERGSAFAAAFFPEPFLTVTIRRVPGGGVTTGVGVFAAAGESGIKRTTTKITAMTIKATAAIVLLRFSVPSCI